MPAALALFLSGIADAEPDTSLGESIYLSGTGKNDEPVQAIVQSDIRVDGTLFACVGCHQRSGFGSSEGGLLVPAVAGNMLFSADETRRPELAEVILRRPAYDADLLRRAIVEGIDANGEDLDAAMPRYDLDDDEIHALGEYLKSLSAGPDPGIDSDTVHLATIVSDRSDPAEVDAILRITSQYFEEKNSGTRLETRRSENAPWHKEWHYSAYRKWKLHIWRLSGPADSWSGQLRDLYRKQPVFAMFGGIAKQDWAPVHDFCESNKIPCLLPNIVNAPERPDSHFSIYFSKGLLSEGEAIRRWIEDHSAPTTIVQLYDSSIGGVNAVRSQKQPSESRVTLIDIDVASEGAKKQFEIAVREIGGSTVVAWLPQDHVWWADLRKQDEIERLIVSSTLVKDLSLVTSASNSFASYSVHQYQIGTELSQNRRLRAWARSRKIELDHVRLQANTYYVLAIVGDALQHIRGNFSREYFLEKVEHMSRRILVKSAYAKLSIAPNQRIMSKGSYIVPVLVNGQLEDSKASWVVP